MRIRMLGATVGMATFITSSALAHHSFTAEFDPAKPINLVGKVKEMDWGNPHAHIFLEVEENGKTVVWTLETGAANALIRRGWRKDSVQPGTVLKVDAWQARNGSHTGNVRSVTFEDGKRLFAGSSNEQEKEK